MLQLEVNISSSQGFSLVNQTSSPNISARPTPTTYYPPPVDHNFIEFHSSTVPLFQMFRSLQLVL